MYNILILKLYILNMIVLLLIIPLIGALLLLNYSFYQSQQNGIVNQLRIKQIALTTTVINFILSLYLWVLFDSSTSQFQFVYEFDKISFCHFNLGVDGISLYFVLLTTFVSPIAILSNWNNITHNLNYFLISFLILESLQIAVFVVLDLFLFYIFFESVLPILFIVILLYGSGEARIRSAFLFFLYTLAGSLFMLLAILQIYSYFGSTDFTIISLNEISLESQKILWLLLSFSKRKLTYRLIHSSNSTLNIGKECKSLVVYMYHNSLGYTLKYKGFSSELRKMCQIPAHLHSIILGVLLSDGWLYKKKSGKTLFALKQINFEYLWLVNRNCFIFADHFL